MSCLALPRPWAWRPRKAEMVLVIGLLLLGSFLAWSEVALWRFGQG